jgi:formylglycine-generating enzyme required for sulfatase activity
MSACSKSHNPTEYIAATSTPQLSSIQQALTAVVSGSAFDGVKQTATEIARSAPTTTIYQPVQTAAANAIATAVAAVTQTEIPTIQADTNTILKTAANVVGTEVVILTKTAQPTIASNVYGIATNVANAIGTQVAVATETTVPALKGDVGSIQTVVANAVNTQVAIQTQTPVETIGNIYSMETAVINAVNTVEAVATQTIVPTIQGNVTAIITTVAKAQTTAEAQITTTVVPTIAARIAAIQTSVASITPVSTLAEQAVMTAVATMETAAYDADSAGVAAQQTVVAVIGYPGLAEVSRNDTYFYQTDGTNYFYNNLDSYWIGKTETTYKLWYTVRTWAVNNGYTFAHAGGEGSNGTAGAVPATENMPVTNVSWRDAIVWCNAYSVLKSLTPCYTYGGSVIKDATNATSCDGAVCDWDANGFRLPTESEWQAAASYIDGSNWTPYNYASGATASVADATATGLVAWYSANCSAINGAGTKKANDLGLYDMSGNVSEWCWDWYASYPASGSYVSNYRGGSGTYRIVRGGSYSFAADYLNIGYRTDFNPENINVTIGFRIARSN